MRSFTLLLTEILALLAVLVTILTVPYGIAFGRFPSWLPVWSLYAADALIWAHLLWNIKDRDQPSISAPDKGRQQGRPSLLEYFSSIPLEFFLFVIPVEVIWGLSAWMLLRAPRLLRLVSFFRITSRWEKMKWSNTGMLRIAQLLFVIVSAIHILACGWYMTAVASGFQSTSWVVRLGLSEASLAEQYVRALYWTITTMTTVGYGDIVPGYSLEFLYACVVMLMGASMYAFLIGNVAALFGNLNSAKVHYWRRYHHLAQFLQQRGISSSTFVRIREYYDYMWERHKGHLKDDLLQDLPQPLRRDVMNHLTQPLTENIPLFTHAGDLLKNELVTALRPQTHAPDTILMQAGEVGNEMMFLSSGSAEILSDDGKNVYAVLERGDAFGMFSLILNEKRTASVRALTFCEVFSLSKSEFLRLKNDYEEFTEVLKKVSSERTERNASLLLDGVVL